MAAYEFYGQEIPDAMLPPDELDAVEWHLMEAFRELSTDRQMGMGAGPIPWSAIDRMSSEFEALGRNTFRRVIRAMDRHFLKAHSENSAKRSRHGV